MQYHCIFLCSHNIEIEMVEYIKDCEQNRESQARYSVDLVRHIVITAHSVSYHRSDTRVDWGFSFIH